MNNKENSVKEKLRAIARLQRTDSDIQKIQILRGELPLEIKDIEDDIAGTQSRLDNFSASAKTLTLSIAAQKNKIVSSKELLGKYKAQLNKVRNNREYDNLTKEIDYQELEVSLAEKKIREFTADLQRRKEEIAELKEKIELRVGDLAAKKEVLDKIEQENKEEEERLTRLSQEIRETIDDQRLLNAYDRIRNGYRNGLAVVPIYLESCGGCFNNIPPQQRVEIMQQQKFIVCEYCGRIIVDNDLFLTEEELAEKNLQKSAEDTSAKTSKRRKSATQKNEENE